MPLAELLRAAMQKSILVTALLFTSAVEGEAESVVVVESVQKKKKPFDEVRPGLNVAFYMRRIQYY